MTSSRFTLFATVCVSLLFTGCAAMFHGKPDLEIIGPPDVQVESVNGGPVQAYRDEGGLIIHPNPALTDSLRITYQNYSTTVALAKNPNGLELLNFLSYGIGFVVDDLSHSWFNYAPVYVTLDSGARGVTGISASSVNWTGETPGERKVDALAIFGLGLSFQLTQTGSNPLPFSFGNISTPLISIQGGLGIDYNKQFELFYLVRSESGYALDNNNDESSVINAGDFCLRYFFQKNLFLQGSFGRAYASDYDNEEYNPVTGSYYTTSSPSFNEVGAAIGWAGDISYISLQYFGGLTSFNTPDYTNIRYHTVYLNFGLNLRI
jgi:hypothetical protein